MNTAQMIAVVYIFFSQMASASGTTEFFFQPGSGVSALSLSATRAVPDVQVDSYFNGTKTTESKLQFQRFDLIYQYGLNESWALMVGAAQLTTSSDTTFVGSSSGQKLQSVGVADYLVGLSGVSSSGSAGLAYGVKAFISSEDSKRPSTTKDGNQFSGGNSYLAHFGGYAGMMSGFVGVDLGYWLKQDRNETDQGNPETKSVLKGGNNFLLTGFYEIYSGSWEYDLRLTYAGVDKLERTTNSSTTTLANASSYTMVGLGLQNDITTSTNLRGEYNYYMYKEAVSPSNSSFRTAAYNVGLFMLRVRLVF